VVIEEFLTGKELSFIVMSDGQVAIPLSTSQDHKARDAGNKGPNTGGMGAYSPVPFVTADLEKQLMTDIVEPTLKGMREQDRFYVGFLYVGVMLTETGPKVLEFNCRLGDPETQPLLMRLTSDLVLPCLAAIEGDLQACELTWDARTALGVVLASRGYPLNPETGFAIKGLPEKPATSAQDKKICHASTQASDGHMINTGGRVLGATALGETLISAQSKAYELAHTISWEGMFFREDIGGNRTAAD
jgi:phosphoribosylamine--glycine ligase